MLSARAILPLITVLTVSACATAPPTGLPALVLPGTGKDPAAFQQDDRICRQHAMAHTGYGALSHDAVPRATDGAVPITTPDDEATRSLSRDNGSSSTTPSAGAPAGDELGYLQCMAARGDIVQQTPMGYNGSAGGTPYPYGFGYPDAYLYGFGYPYPYFYQGAYPAYFGGFYGGWGWGGWRGRGWHGGGWHGGGHGGGHR